MADEVVIGFEPEDAEPRDVHDVFIADGECMISDWEAFEEEFPHLALMHRDGQLFLLTRESAGKFIAIEELVKRKGRKLKAAT